MTTHSAAAIPRPFRALRLLASILLLTALALPAQALDLNVQSEAEYAAVLDAVRAAEYARQNYMEGSGTPRALAVVAGLWAFAERNPLSTPQQLEEFVVRFDTWLTSVVPGDPDLSSYGAVQAALSAARLPSTGVLEGSDTRVGKRALALLGMALPGIDNYEQARLRMTRFDLASVQRLIHRRETADVLTAVLAGVTPQQERRDGLAQTAAAYLTVQGLAPQLGQTDPAQGAINDALDALPDYAAFLLLRDTEGAHLGLEAEAFADIDAIQAQGAALLAAIGTPQVDVGLFMESLSRTIAASNPDDPDHQAALADIEARRAAIVASARATAAQRAGVFARTLLLQQSSFAQVRSVATSTRSFAALQSQTNNHLAVVKEGVGLAGSLLGVAAGFYKGDPWDVVQSLTNVVSSALGLADLFGDSGPSAEEQIFEQILELRRQVEGMRVQLNQRFDVVDAKLDQIFSTMTSGFAELGTQIGQLQQDVNALSASIAEARSSLDRIEDALFGFAQELLLADLSQQTNLVLNYRNNTGVDLPYAFGNPNFVSSASFFHTFATTTSKGVSFAGTPDNQPIVLTLDNAQATLSHSPLARRLNDLRRLPAGLTTASGNAVNGPITAGRVAAPAPWAQAASAYAQLARESPWYFAYLLANQGGGSSGAQVNQIITEGERIVNLANATRGRQDLFDALLHRADRGAELAQQAIDAQIDLQLMPSGLSNGDVRVDAWGPLGQKVSPLLPPIQSAQVTDGQLTSGIVVSMATADYPSLGHEMSVADYHFPALPDGDVTRFDLAERHALNFLLEVGPAQTPWIYVRVPPTLVTGANNTFEITIENDSRASYRSYRRLHVVVERLVDGQWAPIDSTPFSNPPAKAFNFTMVAMSTLRSDLREGTLVGRAYPSGSYLWGFFNYETRLRVTFEFSTSVPNSGIGDNFLPQQEYLTEQLAAMRPALRGAVLSALATPGSQLDLAARRLDNDAVLLDAYLSLGMADAMTQSELLRSAFRGVPSVGGLGFRGGDLLALMLYDAANDSGAIGGSGLGFSSLGQVLQDRILGLGSEIDLALGSQAPSFPYVELVLAELRALRDQAALLAIDETYAIDGPVTIAAASGLLANDIGQPGAIDAQELKVDLAFLDSPQAVRPAHGSLVVAADGGFSYQPDPGFSGVDRFSYRLTAQVGGGGGGNPIQVSEPAMVVLRVGEGVGGEGIFRNGFE